MYIHMCYGEKVKFEWDEVKNLSNFEKHNVWFEEAQTVWADESSLELYDEDHSDSEDRYLRVGVSSRSKTILVIFCERDDGESIRIISARKATNLERRQYEKGI